MEATTNETPSTKGRRVLSDDEVTSLNKAVAVYQENRGFSIRELAEKHGISYQVLNYKLNKLGLKEVKPRGEAASFEFKKRQQEDQILLYPHTEILLQYRTLETLLKKSLEVGIANALKELVKEKRAILITLA